MWIRLCDDGDLAITFQYDEGLVALVRTLPEKRWLKNDRCWIVPREHAAVVVERLQPMGFVVEPSVMELAADPLAAGPPAQTPDLTVAELNERAADAIDRAFTGSVWVVGELYDVSRARRIDASGTLRFSLVQRDSKGKEIARVRAVLFGETRKRLERNLQRAGSPFELQDETAVRLRVRPSLYAAGGSFQIVVDELDVEYTLGDVARRREEVLRRLVGEGLHKRNPALAIPPAPLRVALITRAESDAFHDVRQTLADSGFAFVLTVADVRVQGRDAEPTILRALRRFEARAREFDVLLICRGGGSRVDLSAFDSEAIARSVAALSIPVVVGVGHEQDRSVLDACARSVRTPVAAAELLVEEVLRFERGLGAAMGAVSEQAGTMVRAHAEDLARIRRELAPMALRAASEAERTLQSHARVASQVALGTTHRARAAQAATGHALETATRHAVAREQTRVQTRIEQLRGTSREHVAAPRRHLATARADLLRGGAAVLAIASAGHESAARQIELAHPKRVLEMGYAILRKPSGSVIRSSRAVRAGDAVVAQLADGTLSLEAKHPGPPQQELALDSAGDNGDEENV
ncbi:MAG: exodeoxyribonuclease VII large subunit [Chthonomonadaceae bacterium]|nr:exodeoxyribonuclease VII large subunit [Chthonomonadaceae bacterium]